MYWAISCWSFSINLARKIGCIAQPDFSNFAKDATFVAIGAGGDSFGDFPDKRGSAPGRSFRLFR
jgi:hypothetical protein